MSQKNQPSKKALELVKSIRENSPPLHQKSVEEARKYQEESFSRNDRSSPTVANVRDFVVERDRENVPVRSYEPEGAHTEAAIVFFHGGGWIMGSIESHDIVCRVLANISEMCVISVDYRLAPEHPFPAGLEDCFHVSEWVASNDNDLPTTGTDLIVAGVSSGANLAAAVTLLAREYGVPQITHQILLCPVTDYPHEMSTDSVDEDGYLITAEDLRWCWEKYLSHPLHGYNPLASPLRTHEFADLPPASITTAGFDPLLEDGRRYAECLDAAGVTVNHRNYPEMVHGFMSRLTEPNRLPQAEPALKEVTEDVRDTVKT